MIEFQSVTSVYLYLSFLLESDKTTDDRVDQFSSRNAYP